MKRSSVNWRLWGSLGLFVLGLVMVWPTFQWFSLPEIERDRAEASVQPETSNPHYRALLEEMRQEGGEAMLADYRELYRTSLGTIRLGLDLQGGMYLAYTIEPGPGMEPSEALDQALEVIRNRVDEFGVSEPSITRQGDDRIVVQLPGVRDPARARAIVEKQALLEFKLVAYPNAETSLISTVPAIAEIDRHLASVQASAPDSLQAADSLIPAGNLQPPASQTAGIEGGAVELPMPEQTETSLSGLFEAADEIVAGKLSISPGDWIVRSGEQFDRLSEIITRPGVDSILASRNLQFAFGRETDTPSGTFRSAFLVPRDVTRGWDQAVGVERPYYSLTGASLTNVIVRMGDSQTLSTSPYLILEFDHEGSANWARITGENVDERVSIILDGTVYSVATIRERITGTSTRLSGGFDLEEARDLRLVLKAGSLPARLVIAEEQTIGPSLGRLALNRGMIAGIVGFAIVALFMIAYYSAGGVIATLGLLLNMLLIFAVLCFPGPLARLGVGGLGATLTLPGIAGIVLTIGMAVDANVLIFERIREERRSGKGIRAAVETGFSRAFTTILDSNLTTLITALVLYRFGTGPIRGFAVTLSIGILASLFCSLVFGRSLFDLLLRSPKRSDIHLGVMKFFHESRIPFVAIKNRAYLVSLAVILAGLVAFALRGGFVMSIDFTGGLETSIVNTETQGISELRRELINAGLQNVQVQELEDYAGEGRAFVVRTTTSETETVNAALEETGCSPLSGEAEGLAQIKQIGPRVGSELRSKAFSAVLLSWAAIIIYIWYRFQLKWGFAAVLALVHDTLVTLGFIAVMRIEISLTIIAAVLTIIGYSINDTIVVFDRIRENRRLRKGRTFEETVDISVNETMSRTILTVLTTFLAVMCLFIFGEGEIADFAITMCAGLITGTWSSIFIASMFLVDWRSRRRSAA